MLNTLPKPPRQQAVGKGSATDVETVVREPGPSSEASPIENGVPLTPLRPQSEY